MDTHTKYQKIGWLSFAVIPIHPRKFCINIITDTGVLCLPQFYSSPIKALAAAYDWVWTHEEWLEEAVSD